MQSEIFACRMSRVCVDCLTHIVQQSFERYALIAHLPDPQKLPCGCQQVWSTTLFILGTRRTYHDIRCRRVGRVRPRALNHLGKPHISTSSIHIDYPAHRDKHELCCWVLVFERQLGAPDECTSLLIHWGEEACVASKKLGTDRCI